MIFVVSASAIPLSEKALKLEAMVGNFEDSAFTIVRQTSTNKSVFGLPHLPNFNVSPNILLSFYQYYVLKLQYGMMI